MKINFPLKVAKEMMLCNSAAGLILSTGAGSEMQFSMAGLHSEQDPNYHRVCFVYFEYLILFKG